MTKPTTLKDEQEKNALSLHRIYQLDKEIKELRKENALLKKENGRLQAKWEGTTLVMGKESMTLREYELRKENEVLKNYTHSHCFDKQEELQSALKVSQAAHIDVCNENTRLEDALKEAVEVWEKHLKLYPNDLSENLRDALTHIKTLLRDKEAQ